MATECGPFSKVGGLADVLAALPPALAARGHKVLTVVPFYQQYAGVEPTGIRVPLDLPAPQQEPALQPLLPDADPAGVERPAVSDWRLAEPAAGAGAAAAAAARKGYEPAAGSGGRSAAEQAEEEEEEEEEMEEGSDTGGSGGEVLARHADLWVCQQAGVQRVFVDHPLFASSGAHVKRYWSAPCAACGLA